MLVLWIQTATLLVVCSAVAVFGWVSAPWKAQRDVGRLVSRSGLLLDDELAPIMLGRLRRRIRGTMIGMMAGILIGCVSIVAIGFESGVAWFILCDLLGTGVAALIVHIMDTTRASRELGRRRAATLRPRRLRDFLHPLEIAAPYLGLAVPVLVVGFAFASGQNTTLIVGCAAMAVAVTAAAVAAQRWVLHMAPPADSSNRVVWEDMLRVVSLRDCGVTAYGLSLALAIVQHVTRPQVGTGNTDPLYWFTAALAAASAAGLITLTVFAERSTWGRTRFLGRLYPELGAPR